MTPRIRLNAAFGSILPDTPAGDTVRGLGEPMSRLKKNVPTSRLNLKVPQTVRDRMECLRDETEADSLTEVIRRALAVYELLVEQRRDGWDIVVRRGDEERSVLLM
jgi:hypothetical protein